MRFQFVDRIDALQKRSFARGVKTVSFEEGFLAGLPGEPGCLPRMLLIECAAQLVSWLVLYSTDFAKIPLIAKMEHAEVRQSVPCGTSILLEVEVQSWHEDGAVLDCRASAAGKTIAAGTRCVCTFINSDTLVDPEEMRQRFRELSKEAVVD
jgi:3-hydroxymyristoyl/3-hydroxydecanoyl-(acyl carrier protein) dehydratase